MKKLKKLRRLFSVGHHFGLELLTKFKGIIKGEEALGVISTNISRKSYFMYPRSKLLDVSVQVKWVS